MRATRENPEKANLSPQPDAPRSYTRSQVFGYWVVTGRQRGERTIRSPGPIQLSHPPAWVRNHAPADTRGVNERRLDPMTRLSGASPNGTRWPTRGPGFPSLATGALLEARSAPVERP